MNRTCLLSGNEAIVEGALTAGVRFFAGYPITPSSDIAEMLSVRLPELDGRFVQAEDELASMAMIIGASLAGVRSMTATSGPGFSLMQENIGFAVMSEVPCLVVNVQRGGPSTGLPTRSSQGDVMQMRWGTHGDHSIIVVCPWSVQEAYDLTVRAVTLAEHYRTPVIIALDEITAHMRERAQILCCSAGERAEARRMPDDEPGTYLPYQMRSEGTVPLAPFGSGYHVHVTGLVHDENGFPTADDTMITRRISYLSEKIESHSHSIGIIDFLHLDDAMLVVFAYGSVARSAYSAVIQARENGMKVGLLRIATLWPFPRQRLRQLLSCAKAIIVPEMNLGQMRGEVERLVERQVLVRGLNRVDGMLITPEHLLEKIEEVYREVR